MAISSHARLRIFLTLVAIVAVVSAFAFSMNSSRAASASGPAAVTTFTGQSLIATKATQAQVPLQAKAQAQTNNKLKVRVTPMFRKSNVNALHASAVNGVGAAPNTADTGTGEGKLLQNFKGLNSVDNFNANGFILEPPDQGLCVGYLPKYL